MVGGHHGHGAALAEVFENGHGQRRAFVGLGAGANFIQQHQIVWPHHFRHGLDVRHVGGKGAEVRLNGLLVADVRQHAPEQRQLDFVGGHGNSRLRHQHHDAQRFQGDGFAAGVGPADDHQRFGRLEFQAKVDKPRDCPLCRANCRSGWRNSVQTNCPLRADLRNAAVKLSAEFPLGEGPVDFAQNVRRARPGLRGVLAACG